MMSREFLTRIGVITVALGLTAAPLAFADNQAKEDTNGEHGQSEQATTQNNTATDNGEAVSSEPSEAGGAGMEAQDGTQAGEEPLPEEESDTQTQ